MIHRIVQWPYAALRSPRVQMVLVALFAPYPVFVLTMGSLLTARFTALTGHFPGASQFATPSFCSEITLCEQDRWFGLCAAIFRNGDLFVCGWAGFMGWLLFLLMATLFLKQKGFALQLCALVAFYFLLGFLLDSFAPLTAYYAFSG